jgi:large subunit ribosomal protein L21
MYAVIVTGGKQYRVEVGTELEVELLDVEPGQAITLDRVLLVADGDESAIGRPLVADAAVSAEVVRQTRGEKLIAFKYRPKARSRVKKGHRQELTVLRITDVRLGSKSAAESVRKAEADAKTERQRLEEAAAKQAAVDAALAAKLAKTAPAEAKPTKSSTAKPKASATKADSKTAAKAAPKSAAKATPKKPAAKALAADDKTTKKTAPKAAPKKAAPKTTRPTKDK